MKVSVITPCYNSAAYIVRTIASVQAQSLSDWEMIIVDDGSTDNSASVVEKMVSEDPRIRLLRKENGGTASARKLGLQYAKGDYIQFLDADDTISSDKFERQVFFMQSHNLDVSYTDFRMIVGNEPRSLRGGTCGILRLTLLWGVFGTLPIHSFMYNNSFLKKYRIQIDTSIRLREDWNFHIEVFCKHPMAARMERYDGAQYYVTPGSKSSGNNPLRLHMGNLQFLQYKIAHSKGFLPILLLIRLSIEYWFLFLHILKYYRSSSLSILATGFQTSIDICISLLAICIMPFTLSIIMVYIILTRIDFFKNKFCI